MDNRADTLSATYPDTTQNGLEYCFAFYMEISSRTHTIIRFHPLSSIADLDGMPFHFAIKEH